MTLFTRMKRTFDTPAPKELLTNPQSSGGSYRLTSSEDLIAYHRRLKRGSPWSDRIHRGLNLSLFLSFLSILFGVWFSVLCCNQSDSVKGEGYFTTALWACGVFTVLVLTKIVWNSRYPN